ncbi:MAG: tellurite resistance TerB family protein [Methanobacteriaceae archaeon]|nr:tellurite resistance TerB family protein [Methanobacteriaceae archaeon]
MTFRNQFNEEEWLILQAAPIWVFEVVAIADGRIDDEELEEVLNQSKNIIEYSTGFTYEVFKDHITTIMNNNLEFRNLLKRNPLEGLKIVADLLGRLKHSEAQNFKKMLLKMAIKVANSSAGVDKNEEKAIAIIMGILDGIL